MATSIASPPITQCKTTYTPSTCCPSESLNFSSSPSSYPGWDVYIDPSTKPAPSRIAFGGGNVNPIFDLKSAAMACGSGHTPAPGSIAEVRAGSNITFHWSRWLYSHKGPMTAWMAPYEGAVGKVNVNQLEFVKFAEDTIDSKGVWATDRFMDQTNGTFTGTIPADIKPGNYIIRQEVCLSGSSPQILPVN